MAAELYANIVLPTGTIIHTPWIGNALGPDWMGLMWTKRLAGICVDENKIKGPKYWTDKLNDMFKGLPNRMYIEKKPKNVMSGKERVVEDENTI